MNIPHTQESPDTAVSYVISGLELLDEIGVSRTLALKDTGLTDKELINIDGLVHHSKIMKMLENIEVITGLKGIGLYFGNRLGFYHHGMLGVAASSHLNFKDAIDTLVKYAQVRFQGVKFSHVNRGEYFGLGIELNTSSEKYSVYLTELIFATVYSYVKTWTSAKTTEAIVRLNHSKPDYYNLYPDVFGVMPEFDAGCSEMLICSTEFNKTLSPAGNETLEYALKLIEKELPVLVECDFYNRVKSIVERSASISSIPRIESIAETCNVSIRTVRRKLRRSGKTYKYLVNSKKCIFAEIYLENEGYTIGDVAEKMGFSNSSAFTKAFTSWKGLSPRGFREILTKDRG